MTAARTDAAFDGQVVYLMCDGQPVAAVMLADVATAGAATFEATVDPATRWMNVAAQ